MNQHFFAAIVIAMALPSASVEAATAAYTQAVPQ